MELNGTKKSKSKMPYPIRVTLLENLQNSKNYNYGVFKPH